MKSPLVSICCICYNQERFIQQTLIGFITQRTEFTFEVVISDDYSNDNTRQIIHNYKKQYSSLIRDVSPEKNIGMMSNFWHVQAEAKGKYLAFCEGDDYWTDPYKLQKQVDFMEKNLDIGLCYTDYSVCNDTGAIIKDSLFERCGLFTPINYEDFLLKNMYIAPMTWMCRKSVLDKLDLSYVTTDGTFVYALEFMMNSKVAYLPINTAVYRSHVGSVSKPLSYKGLFKQYNGVFISAKQFCERYKNRICQEVHDKLLSKWYIELLYLAVMFNDKTFINEAELFFEDRSIDFSNLYSLAKKYCIAIEQRDNAWKSKRYKIGKFLLHPFKIFQYKCSFKN